MSPRNRAGALPAETDGVSAKSRVISLLRFAFAFSLCVMLGSCARVDRARARSVADAHEIASDHYQFNYLLFNVSRAPLDERAVRETIVRGVDRDGIERRVRGELYRPGDGDRLPGQFAYDPAIHQAPYDPAGATRLLDGAGWKMHDGVRSRNGTPLSLEIVGVAGSSGSERVDVQLQAELAKLGIRVQTKSYLYPLLFAPAQDGGIFASGRFDLANYGWQPGEDADHSYLFRCATRPPNGENYGRICDPVFDREAALELQSTDPQVQLAPTGICCVASTRRATRCSLGFDREVLFVRRGLEGVEPSVLGRHFWNIERWETPEHRVGKAASTACSLQFLMLANRNRTAGYFLEARVKCKGPCKALTV